MLPIHFGTKTRIITSEEAAQLSNDSEVLVGAFVFTIGLGEEAEPISDNRLYFVVQDSATTEAEVHAVAARRDLLSIWLYLHEQFLGARAVLQHITLGPDHTYVHVAVPRLLDGEPVISNEKLGLGQVPQFADPFGSIGTLVDYGGYEIKDFHHPEGWKTLIVPKVVSHSTMERMVKAIEDDPKMLVRLDQTQSMFPTEHNPAEVGLWTLSSPGQATYLFPANMMLPLACVTARHLEEFNRQSWLEILRAGLTGASVFQVQYYRFAASAFHGPPSFGDFRVPAWGATNRPRSYHRHCGWNPRAR